MMLFCIVIFIFIVVFAHVNSSNNDSSNGASAIGNKAGGYDAAINSLRGDSDIGQPGSSTTTSIKKTKIRWRTSTSYNNVWFLNWWINEKCTSHYNIHNPFKRRKRCEDTEILH